MSVTIKHTNPNAIQKVYQRFSEATKKEVAVGFPRGKCQAYPDGTQVASVAAYHVYGLGVPRRDFMNLAMGDIKAKAIPIMKEAMQAQSDREADALLNAAGEMAKAAIQKAIVDLDTPPNAPSTIARKGTDNPLIDNSHMLQSVTHVVRNKTK